MGKRRRVRTDGAPRLGRPLIDGKPAANWHVIWSDGTGRSRRRSTGIAVALDPKQVHAKTWLADWMAARRRIATHDPPFDEVIDAYLDAREKAGIRSPDTLRAHFVVIRERLGRHRISALTDHAISDFIDFLKDPPAAEEGRKHRRPASQGTINKKVRCIRQALEHGRRKKLFAVEKPEIDKVKRGAVRKRFLSRPEGIQLLEAAHDPQTAPHVRLFVYLALGTAQRMSAILELTWSQIDFEHAIIWFSPSETANKNRVTAPMSPGVRFMLEEARRNARTEHVIEYRDDRVATIRKGFQALVKRAGLKNVRVHDLRRTAASWAIMAGASFAEVAALLGDDEAVVKAHYGHFHPTYLKGTTDRIDPGRQRSAPHRGVADAGNVPLLPFDAL